MAPIAATARRLPWRRLAWVLPLLAAMVVLALQLSFLCDDAYIAFRYVSNAHLGHGLCWNPPPFQPVEGYTSFLWVVLLWCAWSWLQVEPPDAAHALSLLAGAGQFALVLAAVLRLRDRGGRPLPDLVAFAVLAAVVGNRTFVSWLTSGLETSLFNLALLAWVLLACRAPDRRGPRWLLLWSLAAAAAALTRPDGLLFAAATGAVGLVLAAREPAPRRLWLGLLPLLAVAAHLLWRRSFYGEWLPNTYYAKVGAAWPEAGLRYFICFAVEHGVWLWVPLCIAWLCVELRAGAAAVAAALRRHLPAAAAAAALLFQAGYYTLVVGGDHFEYRVYSHLVPLGALAAAAMALRLVPSGRARPWLAPFLAVLAIGLAAGAGWLHLLLTRDMPWHGFRPVQARLPAILQPAGRWYDRQQAWLRLRMIGLRCNHHAAFLARMRQTFPRRMQVEGATDPFPVFATGGVGLCGWSLPDAVVLDMYGLNDWVIARAPVRDFGTPPAREQLRALFARGDGDGDGFLDAAELRTLIDLLNPAAAALGEGEDPAAVLLAVHARQRPGALTQDEAAAIGESLVGARSMAHEHEPPPGYLEELQPNVVVQGGRATARPRAVPLTAAAIAAFEAKWRAMVRR